MTQLVRAKALSKRSGTWRCFACHTTTTKLYRSFGQSFFREANKEGREAAAKRATHLMIQKEVRTEFYEEKGKFFR